MPVHDWSRVEAGVYHHFHNLWISRLSDALNSGLLPAEYYALVEQHAGQYVPDILTLHASSAQPPPGKKSTPGLNGGNVLTISKSPPRVRQQLVAATYRRLRRTLAIRHTSGHRLVAIIEITSPANKDRPGAVAELVRKIVELLHHGVHVLLVDVFACGRYDRPGLHEQIWAEVDGASPQKESEPVTLASYVAAEPMRAYVERVKYGEVLPEMPVFLTVEHYVLVPLERAYEQAWAGVPAYWQRQLQRRKRPRL
jgi:hypothetical protein